LELLSLHYSTKIKATRKNEVKDVSAKTTSISNTNQCDEEHTINMSYKKGSSFMVHSEDCSAEDVDPNSDGEDLNSDDDGDNQ